MLKFLFVKLFILFSLLSHSQQDFDYVFHFSEGLAPFSKDGKFGFINHLGEVVIEPNYHLVEHFENGLAKVKMYNKWGLINSKDEFVAYCKYDQIGDLNEELIFVKIDYHFGFINHLGEEVFPVDFWDKYWEDINIKKNVIIANNNYKYGLLNVNKDTIIPFDYDYLEFVNDQVIRAFNEQNGLSGLLDFTGKIVIPIEYDYFNQRKGFQEGLIPARHKLTKKYGYIDKNNNTVIDFKFDYAEPFSNKLAFVRNEEFFGVINKKGKLILPYIYEETVVGNDGSSLIIEFIKKRAIVSLNDSIIIIDKKGNIVDQTDYDEIHPLPNSNLAVVLKNDLMGIISTKNGSIIVPIKYDKLHPLNEGKIFAEEANKISCFTINGKLLFESKYDANEKMRYVFIGNTAIVSKDEKYGFVNKKAKEITPIIFDGCQHFKNGIAPVNIDGKAYYINKKNKCTLLCK